MKSYFVPTIKYCRYLKWGEYGQPSIMHFPVSSLSAVPVLYRYRTSHRNIFCSLVAVMLLSTFPKFECFLVRYRY
jgi:hypothetical protein